MKLSYSLVSILAAGLCFILFLSLLLVPDFIYWVFGIIGNDNADLMSRRAGMLFLGLAFITFQSRNTAASNLRKTLCLGLAIMMAGLAMMGIFEYIRGAVGLGIWLAILTEIAFSFGYFMLSKSDH
ncbi:MULTISPECIES: hypothetical protein [unclassified Lentilitoribacter]|jgi:hypothetical protein|uniref:hypothetical protein n=1 Tax=unclassified Lentilitoribacter TaxID=2647570 RepID=UPI0013A6CBBB|nr:hypothetical protein [Lentilitoribacter sp. Alg239-R112]